jgi:MtrB/PioB family decaheme-associated outer membrane protein
MRTRVGMLLLVLLLPVVPAAAQVVAGDVLPGRPLNFVDFGLRGTDLSGDPARFQRYRDLGDGAFLNTFRLGREGENWLATVQADYVGRRDQRYTGQVLHGGRIKLSVVWDQIPLLISRDTRTLYATEAPGVLRLDDAIQQGLQAGTFTLAQIIDRAVGFETQNRRDTAEIALTYTATRDLDLNFRLTSASREGNMPWGATFGLNHAVEVPGPIDHRTTDLAAGVEWANQRGMFRVGYDGSWFQNDIQTLIWDNPLRFTDITTGTANIDGRGTSQGRTALWPDSTRHTVSTAGAIRLPRRSSLAGSVAVGSLNQNEPLLPFTINTAIPTIPLPRATAEAEARTLATNLNFTSRPHRMVWLNARYRHYDFDNRTPHFPVTTYVRADQNVNTLAAGGPEPFSVSRHQFDADVSVTPVRFTNLKLGYGRQHVDRTFRVFESTVEDVFRASADAVGHQLFNVRVVYEHAARRGRGLDLHVLELVSEQPGMRHYDVATRDRDRVTVQLGVTPLPILGFTASLGAGKDDYRESQFGLRDNTHRVYSAGADLVPDERVSFGAWYVLERYETLQFSRQAAPGPQFNDPTRDWATDTNDRVHTVTASLDLLRLVPRTDLRVWYDHSSSRARYIYRVAVPTDRTLPLGSPVPTTLPGPQQLPPVTSELQRSTVDGRYFFTEQFGLGLSYWYDQFRVQDFALGPDRLNRLDLPGGIILGYLYRPYRAHSAWLRIFYLW